MERALAAIHEACHPKESLTLRYAAIEGRVGLFLDFAEALEERVTAPVAANYPNCRLTAVPRFDQAPPDWTTWSTGLHLTPEIFPILRHAQFEDLLNGTYADPINGILRAI